MADLTTTLCGSMLKTPLILSSGPLSGTAEGIARAFAAGASAVVTKTIARQAAINPVPHIVTLGRDTLLNAEKWSDLAPERWLREELPALRDREGVLIVSLGHTVEDVAALAAPLVAAGANLLEVVSYRAEDMAPMVAVAKRLTDAPVLAKISPNWPDLMGVVDACIAAGANGVTAMDSLGPALAIDVETGRPLLGSAGGSGWLSGAAMRPLTVSAVADICQRYDVPVVATGGVTRTEDVVEMIMVGAAAVGAHSAPLLRGLDWFRSTAERLDAWLNTRAYGRVGQVRGLALEHLGRSESTVRVELTFDADKCNQCGRCVTVCAYNARSLVGKEMSLRHDRCRQCCLCVRVCPNDALGLAVGR